MKGRIPEALFLDILEAREKVAQDWQDIRHGMSVIFLVLRHWQLEISQRSLSTQAQ